MKIDEFRALDEKLRNQKPKLFELSAPDNLATEEQLTKIAQSIGIELPSSYKEFLREFGGGNYGLSVIFSADPASEWYLPVKFTEAGNYLPSDLLPFSDDFSGGYYVFKLVNAAPGDAVYYWNQDGGLVSTSFTDLFDFLAHSAYE